jgi:ribosomal protein L37AE/L43A
MLTTKAQLIAAIEPNLSAEWAAEKQRTRMSNTIIDLSSLDHEGRVASVLTAGEPAIRSAIAKLSSARRKTVSRAGGRKRSDAPRCPRCSQDTLATIATRGKCRGCGWAQTQQSSNTAANTTATEPLANKGHL